MEHHNEQKVDTIITGFTPRWYQTELIRAIFVEKKRKAVLNWCRRSGKDMCVWQIVIWLAIAKRCTIFYIFPTLGSARSSIWSAITNDGKTFLSYIPRHLIAKLNEARMEVHFINGSIIALKGSTNFDSLRGSNPFVCVFSEYAYQDNRVYPLVIKPIMSANQGLCIFMSTPSGKNHFYELYEIAKQDPEGWYSKTLTIEDAGHIDVAEIKHDVQVGVISEDFMLQEYYCSFSRGIGGSIFGRLLQKLYLEERVTFVHHEPNHPVHVSFDLGWDDDTALIFFQVIGTMVRVIDIYSNRQKETEHYAQVMHNKGYTYGKVFLPHDAAKHEMDSGDTRVQTFYNFGFNVEILPRKHLPDRLEDGKCLFAKLWIDERCVLLLKALENYRREWDDKLEKYKEVPVHDKWSHFADAFTYMAGAVALGHMGGMTQQDADELRARALAKHSPWGY